MKRLSEKLQSDLGKTAVIDWEFEEESGWGGIAVLRNGLVDIVDSWDSPDD